MDMRKSKLKTSGTCGGRVAVQDASDGADSNYLEMDLTDYFRLRLLKVVCEGTKPYF